ncbi:MAG TPA: efflux RND transporter periplasmic adaptor subunit [Bacteroides sp.]|nr:efflux RND transporter periplasmic adaptor subunit [Bacteroides sp.]
MKRFFIPLVLVSASLVFFTRCKTETPQQAPPPEVRVVKVIQQDFPRVREFVGQTYGQADIAIRARVEGFLTGIYFDEGYGVKKGQLLYSIDPQPFLAAEAEALSKLAEAKTLLVKAKSDLDRYRPLAEINAVSQADLDFAVAQHGASEAYVEAAEASLRAVRIQLGYTKMYSPINGIIGRTQAKIGDFVGREPNPVVLNTVSNIESVQVRFFLTEYEYIFLTRYIDPKDINKDEKQDEKDNLTLILADGSEHEFKGNVDFVDRSIDPRTGSILVQASFPNPGYTLRPGQFARVLLEFENVKDALLVPQRCITELQGQQSVFVVDDNNVAEFRQVEASVTKDGLWLIESGLSAGETVVFEGLQKIRSGVTVNPVQAEINIPSGESENGNTRN